jgi:hypothetical protein
MEHCAEPWVRVGSEVGCLVLAEGTDTSSQDSFACVPTG